VPLQINTLFRNALAVILVAGATVYLGWFWISTFKTASTIVVAALG